MGDTGRHGIDMLREIGRAFDRSMGDVQNRVGHAASVADLHARGRVLTLGELKMIRWMFGPMPGVERARVYPWNFWWPIPNDRAMTPNGSIYFPHQDYRDDFSLPTVPVLLRALFMHEATHLYQFYRLGIWVMVRGLIDRKYDYELEKGKKLKEYRLEQMGQIVQDFYSIHYGGRVLGRAYEAQDYADALPVAR